MSSDSNRNIASRTLSGSAYSVAASVITLTLGFVRMTIMLRFLLPEHFGVTTLALFYINLVGQLRGLGLSNAFIHRRQEETNDTVRATFFTLQMGLVIGSLLLLIAFIPLITRLYPDMSLLGIVLLAMIGTNLFKGFNTVQTAVLSKQMAFRAISITDVASSVVMTVVGPLLAWQGFGVWSIVAENFSGIFTRTLLIWIFYRRWRPRLGWDSDIARWFWQYGRNIWGSSNLTFLIDRFDDFWIGTTLGDSPLGFYSRAYEYARYPRKVVANPILSVFFPAFASLQGDRLRLSRAFFRATSLMIRAGGLFSLLFILTAPEFIELLLTARWLPMLFTFQLMIVYTLFDPIALGASNLLMATGYPHMVMRTRIIQSIIFIPAVIGLSALTGIEGVALAANIMIVVGTVLLFRYTKQIIDYSQRALWLWPLVAVMVTAVPVWALNPVWNRLPLWGALMAKGAAITVIYLSFLWFAERHQLLNGWRMIWGLLEPMLRRENTS